MNIEIYKKQSLINKLKLYFSLGLLIVLSISCSITQSVSKNDKNIKDNSAITFAIIGDYGEELEEDTPNPFELSVAKLVNESFCPEFIITMGDNNYNQLSDSTYRRAVGNFYADYNLANSGKNHASRNCDNQIKGIPFYPTIGNCDVVGACHSVPGADYKDVDTYSNYFNWANQDHAENKCETLITEIQKEYPNYQCPDTDNYENLFYDFKKGPVHFFVLNTYCPEAHENGGCYDTLITENPTQINDMLLDTSLSSCIGQYLRQMIWMEYAAKLSTAAWKIAYFHNPPYSAGNHNSCSGLQFDYEQMGIDLILSGHNHCYNRVSFLQDNPKRKEYVYLTIGLSGVDATKYGCVHSLSGYDSLKSNIVYDQEHGAMKVNASSQELKLRYYKVTDWNIPVDEIVLKKVNRKIEVNYCPNGCNKEGILNCKN